MPVFTADPDLMPPSAESDFFASVHAYTDPDICGINMLEMLQFIFQMTRCAQ